MERNKLARQIIDTCLEMTRLGLNQGTAGNVSVRYQDGMLITPTGIPYEKLTESHIVFIPIQNCRFLFPVLNCLQYRKCDNKVARYGKDSKLCRSCSIFCN